MDLLEAFAEKNAAETAAQWVKQQDPGGSVWFIGHWGFQFYAKRAGLEPLIPNQSRVREGDWLIMPDSRVWQQQVHLDQERIEVVAHFAVSDVIPLSTKQAFYGGRTPLEHLEGPRVSVAVYKVKSDFIAGGAR